MGVMEIPQILQESHNSVVPWILWESISNGKQVSGIIMGMETNVAGIPQDGKLAWNSCGCMKMHFNVLLQFCTSSGKSKSASNFFCIPFP